MAGHFSHAGSKVYHLLQQIADNERARDQWPVTCRVVKGIAQALYDVETDMDKTLSGDQDPGKASDDKEMAGHVLGAFLREIPDQWLDDWEKMLEKDGRG